jgi:hypothetical protein
MSNTLQNDSVHSSYVPYGSNPNSNNAMNTSACLNEKLQTEYIDISDDDTTTYATITRTISRFVGHVFTPRQVLGLLRVLKAITLSFLVLTILSDVMYIIFVELLANDKIQLLAGGHRDTIIRIYGLLLALIGLAIELDYSKVVRKFSALKGFIPRSLIYFFVMQITGSHPIMIKYKQNKNHAQNNYEIYDDDLFDVQNIQIPSSAIGFQRVTAFVLYVLFYYLLEYSQYMMICVCVCVGYYR